MIERPTYLNQLIAAKDNGFPKVITGVRRCGKSYLLSDIFKPYLLDSGIKKENIVILDLNDIENAKYRDPIALDEHIRSIAKGTSRYYIMLDEIQRVFTIVNPKLTEGKHVLAGPSDKETISFVDVVLGLAGQKNIDLYVTGSNSKMLSSDIVSDFRDKDTEIHLMPVSFQEFYNYKGGSKEAAYYEYAMYGGMPLAILKRKDEKENYLKRLFKTTYFKDILEHNNFKKTETLDEICNLLSQTVGQFQNTSKIASTIKSVKKEKTDEKTIGKYIDSFIDAFLIRKANRYDIKGKSLLGATRKYYFSDIGLRNARLNFVFPDFGQIMENVIFNELIYHGWSVNVGSFDSIEKDKNGSSIRKTNEIDFVAEKGGSSIYIQSCKSLAGAKNPAGETRPFDLVKNAYRKIIVTGDPIPESKTEKGYEIINIVDFLLSL